MTGYRLTPAAQRDLSSIWDLTAEGWHAEQAETYISEIRLALERLAVEPSRGRPCDDVREGYRRDAIGSHRVFFKQRAGGVDVIRILHQRMDPVQHL